MNNSINLNEIIYKLEEFIQIHTSYFTIEDFCKFSNILTKEHNLFIKELLISSGLFYIDITKNKKEIFICKNNFFINKKFRIKISHFEKNMQMFIPASRFSPFIPNTIEFQNIKLYFKGEPIPQKKIQLTFNELKNFYFLSTENDFFHAMNEQDKRNAEIIKTYNSKQTNIKFFVSVFDFSKIYTELHFSSMSWILIKIINWEKGEFELLSDTEFEPNNFYINYWYDNFDFFVKEALELLPIDTTINDVMGLSYFLGREEIFTEKNIPMECFFEERDSFAICKYGIEEKFWATSKPIPMPNTWFSSISNNNSYTDNFFSKLNLPITEQILEQLCLDFLSKNYIDRLNNNTRAKFIKKYEEIFISGKLFNYKKKKNICRKILLDIYDKNVLKYNPFIDIELHNFRKVIVTSYIYLIELLKKINEKKLKPKNLKNDSPLMLYQLFEKIEYSFIFISKIDMNNGITYDILYDFLDNFENMSSYVNEIIESELKQFL